MPKEPVTTVFGGNGTSEFITGPYAADPLYQDILTITYPVPDPFTGQINFYEISTGVLNTEASSDNIHNHSGSTDKNTALHSVWTKVLANPAWKGIVSPVPSFSVLVPEGETDIIGNAIKEVNISVLQIGPAPPTNWWMNSQFGKYGWMMFGRGSYNGVEWLNMPETNHFVNDGYATGLKVFMPKGFIAQVTAYQPLKIPPLLWRLAVLGNSGTFPEEDVWTN